VLRVLSWADYFCPERIAAFERGHDCKVDISGFASNEELHERLRGGERTDVMVPSTYMRVMLQEEAYLAPLSTASDAAFSIPYLRGVSGLAWMDGQSPGKDACSWSWIPAVPAGRITLLDDMRETIGAALKFLGHSANSTDEKQLVEAVAVVQEWKQRISAFESEYYKIGLVAGEYDLVHGYSGDVLQAAARNPRIRFAIPAEGALFSTDEFCIDARSGLKDLAAAFIRDQSTPESLDAHARYTGYWPAGGEPPHPTISMHLDADALRRSEEISPLGPAASLWADLWREIRRD
jgi:spermidine/putrescine transport system substrate-binding protein